MKLFRYLSHAFRTGRSLSLHSHAYWGRCAECGQATPWMTNAWVGLYRCTNCGADQLASTPRD